MRAVITYTAVLLVLLFSGKAFAAMSEDASWERDADAAVWDDAVARGAMPRTSFSSASAASRNAAIRQEARRMLEHSKNSGTTDIAVAAAILKDTAGQGVLPVTELESSLITGALILSSLHHCHGLSLEGTNRDRYGHSVLCAAAIAGNGTSRTGAAKKPYRKKNNENNNASRVNLVQYATDCGKADYYGLFLYLWEDGPWDTKKADIFSRIIPPLVSIREVYSNNPAPSCTPSHIPLTFPFITETIPGVRS